MMLGEHSSMVEPLKNSVDFHDGDDEEYAPLNWVKFGIYQMESEDGITPVCLMDISGEGLTTVDQLGNHHYFYMDGTRDDLFNELPGNLIYEDLPEPEFHEMAVNLESQATSFIEPFTPATTIDGSLVLLLEKTDEIYGVWGVELGRNPMRCWHTETGDLVKGFHSAKDLAFIYFRKAELAN